MTSPIAAVEPIAYPKKVTILGSTGTIGQNTIKLINQTPEHYEIQVLTARKNLDLLIQQARELQPKHVVIEDESLFEPLKQALSDLPIDIAAGTQAIIDAAGIETDWTMSAIVGAAALAPTLAAIRQGNIVALANKECLVCAGEIVAKEVNKYNATLLPVDSEHNALFQIFDFDTPSSIESITLTASGGPFRTLSIDQMKSVSVKEAIAHPNWNMGAKISIDSATMMNKGLEMIEAYYLFPIEKEQINIIVHPESIVHSLVTYIDGTIIAGMSTTDMRVPIAFTLGWPQRIHTNTPKLDLMSLGRLSFQPPDKERFLSISLCENALRLGGNMPTILNAANEVAVEQFIEEKIPFLTIAKLVEKALEHSTHSTPSSLDDIIAIDAEARALTYELAKTL